MTEERKFTAYERLLFALAGNSQNLTPIAKQHLGHDAYTPKGFFRYAAEEVREIVELLWNQPEIYTAISKLTPAAHDYYMWINEAAPRGTTSDFESVDHFVESYIADAKKLHVRQHTERSNHQLNSRIQTANDWELADVAAWHEEQAYKIKQMQSGKGGLKLAPEFAKESVAGLDNMAHGRLDREMMPFMINGNMRNPVQMLTGGIPLGSSMMLAGTSGVGKTRLAQNIAFSYAQYIRHEGKPSSVMLIPLEVPAKHWIEGYAASRVNVNVQDGRRGLWKPDSPEYLRIREEVEKLGRLNIASLEKYRAPNANKAEENMEHMVRLFGGVGLIVLDFMRLAGTNQQKREENLRAEDIAYEFSRVASNFENPDGTKPCVLIVTEVKKEATPPYSQEDIKYGGTYAAGSIMFIVDMKSTVSIPAAVGMMARAYSKAGLTFNASQIQKGDMMLQMTKVRYGERDVLFPGFRYIGEYTKWAMQTDWEKFYLSPAENAEQLPLEEQ